MLEKEYKCNSAEWKRKRKTKPLPGFTDGERKWKKILESSSI